MKVLITGGSGLIGNNVTQQLLSKGVDVVHLTRSKNSRSGVKTYEWNWETGEFNMNSLEGVTHIIHLAGAGIADKPWTMKRKRFIIKSRVETARLLLKKVNEKGIKLDSFISASGIGYYGASTSEKIYQEEDEPNEHFISKCCQFWEESADNFSEITRVVKFRIGMVLSDKGGGIPKIASSVRSGFGAPLGKGSQFVPWIHIEDLTKLFIFALENDDLKGTYNAVSSQHISNKELTFSLALAMNKKIRLPNIPKFVIKTIYGELSDIILEGSRVSNDKIKASGFKFEFENIQEAMNNLYKKN